MTKTRNFKKGLIESIKVAGQMMIDMAEDIAGTSDGISNLNVSFEFSPDMRSIPELTITRSHLPNPEKIEMIMNSFYEKENKNAED